MSDSTVTSGGKNYVGEKLTQIRKSKGLSQQELALLLNERGCNLSMTGISRIEKGNRRIYDFEIICLCKVLGITLNDLYFG